MSHNRCMDTYRRQTDKMKPPIGARSINSEDYQSLRVAVAVMPKHFDDGDVVEPHMHQRDQVIYAIAGLMRVRTKADTWVVPPDRALLMPAGVEHSIKMSGQVEMRTLYISPTERSEIRVVTVRPLLRELITNLAEMPVDYSGNARAEQIAELILTELVQTETLPLNIPMPRDKRLQYVCHLILGDPSNSLTLVQLSNEAGASAKTLARLSATELGMGFSKWRQRVRFAKALELLEKGWSVKQIASECGYDSPSAFTHAFSKEYGMPPGRLQRSQEIG